MSSAPGPGKWQLAGIFLLVALPMMAAAWKAGVYDNARSDWTEIGLLTAPVIAAVITGAWWRSRLSFYPNWAMRRPYSRRMAITLLIAEYVLNITVLWLLLMAGHGGGWINPLDAYHDQVIVHLDGRTIMMLIPVILIQLLICMIQTEIGLFLGVWIMDRIEGPSFPNTEAQISMESPNPIPRLIPRFLLHCTVLLLFLATLAHLLDDGLDVVPLFLMLCLPGLCAIWSGRIWRQRGPAPATAGELRSTAARLAGRMTLAIALTWIALFLLWMLAQYITAPLYGDDRALAIVFLWMAVVTPYAWLAYAAYGLFIFVTCWLGLLLGYRWQNAAP